MLDPANALNASGKHKAKLLHVSGFLNYLDPAVQDWVMPADLIVFQRNVVAPEVFDALDYFMGLGKTIAIDLDDAYPILPWSNPAHRFWLENPEKRNPDPINMLETGLQKCGHLIAPNRLLLALFSHVAQGHYLQNYACEAWWTNLPTRAELKAKLGTTGRIVIGWGGSVSHYDSWWGSGVREAATRVCKRHPEVVWMVCGNDPRIVEQLPVPFDQKLAQPGVEPSEWPKIVQSFDIGIAPLSLFSAFDPHRGTVMDAYDLHRSWIKGIEYSLAGVPWLATKGEPYRDIAHLGMVTVNGAEQWEAHLELLIRDLKQEQERAESMVPMARQMFLASHQVETMVKVYQEIASDRTTRGQLPGILRVGAE